MQQVQVERRGRRGFVARVERCQDEPGVCLFVYL